jgi:hypothetical protein
MALVWIGFMSSAGVTVYFAALLLYYRRLDRLTDE